MTELIETQKEPHERAVIVGVQFRNTEEFTVVVEGETRDTIKNPKVLRTMEAFQRHMENIPEVGATSSLADLLPGIIRSYWTV